MDKLTSDIEKLENQIELLKRREEACDSKRFIYIDCLVDDHVQKNKKKSDHDTKKIASINEIKESMEASEETTKKIKKIDKSIEEAKEKIVELEMKDISKNKEKQSEEQEDKSNNIIYYLIMLGIIIFIVLFFIFLMN